MSSAWWLGQQCMLGMNSGFQTTKNLLRERECVLNLMPDPARMRPGGRSRRRHNLAKRRRFLYV
jgi:hypothetical protein